MINFDEKLKEEIESRLHSKSWDMEISNKVLHRVNSKKRFNIFKFSMAGGLALIVMVFSLVLKFNSATVDSMAKNTYYDEVINQQVNGVYGSETNKELFLDDEGTERLIDTALLVR